MVLDKIIQEHDDQLEEHESDICHIRQDLVDIKTRLGIKDLTNGQVLKYYEQLTQTLDDEKQERKESDKVLREDIKEIDNKLWAIVTGIILMCLLNIGLFIFQFHFGG